MSAKCYVGRRRRMTVQDWARLGWDREHAERYALLDHTTAEVVVLDRDGVRPLAHHVRHSPNGFSWGYAGSGPSELARCILLEHFGLPAPWASMRGSSRRSSRHLSSPVAAS
jgi:uncharacterized protein DUF6166